MGIKQHLFNLQFSNKQKKTIRFFKPLKGNEWDCRAADFRRNKRGLAKNRNELKVSIRKQLEIFQGTECAFCGLELKTRVAQIEHIAPKGNAFYPHFMFEKKNLVLACSLCNGFEKKGTSNTILVPNQNYRLCEFNIIHPYFDNPNDHLEYINDPSTNLAYLIQVKEVSGIKSTKGEQTISLFDLDSTAMTEERYKDALAASQPVQPDFEALIAGVKNRQYIS